MVHKRTSCFVDIMVKSGSFLVLDSRIRRRVFTILKVNFPKLATAEEQYNLTLSNCLEEMEASISSAETIKSNIDL